MRLVLAAFVAAFSCLFSCLPALADDKPAAAGQSFEALFAPLSTGGCVKIDDVRAAGATVTLTPEQFQFVRAFWMAVPPVSHELPPGDKAFLAKDQEGKVALGLYGEQDGQVCAVFEATDWMQKLVDEVGRGEVGKRGEPL